MIVKVFLKRKILSVETVSARARAHARTHARTHAHTRTHTHTGTNTHARAHTHTHTQTRTHARTHTHTHARTHTHIHTHARTHTNTQALTHAHSDYTGIYLHTLKQAENRMDEDSSTERKTWQVHSFGKRNVFRLHLNESGEEGEAHSVLMDRRQKRRGNQRK